MEKIGLLAGVGTLPVEFAEAVRSQGYEVVCVAVIPGIDPRLKEIANVYYDISAFKLNKIIKTLVKENVKEVTMIGKVTKEWLYKDHVLPDLRAIKVLNRLRKANFKDDTITLAIVEELAKDGISVLDQTKYLKPLMPGPQVFTKKKPTEEQMADVAFGFKAAKAIGARIWDRRSSSRTAPSWQSRRSRGPTPASREAGRLPEAALSSSRRPNRIRIPVSICRPSVCRRSVRWRRAAAQY